MGFSVSGAAAILLAAALIAFGMSHSAVTNSFERVSDAEQDRADEALAEGNTEIEITSASQSSSVVTVEVTNHGATALSLNSTEIFIDNEYEPDWQADAEIDGEQKPTDLWLPGETIAVNISVSEQANRVKVTTENGVSDTVGVN
jgi:flagellar protein FlaF